MASHNNHRTQQQSWVQKGGGSWKRNVSSSPHQSEINFNSKKQQEVIHRLQDMFMDVLDLDVIQSVAQNCEFDCKYCHFF
jgi:predicted nucleic acid-binding protein